MRKLLVLLLGTSATLSFASSLDMNNLYCGGTKATNNAPATGYKVTQVTTLADVQKNCLIKKQTTSKGRFEVKFTNTATDSTVECFFASNNPTATLNSCK